MGKSREAVPNSKTDRDGIASYRVIVLCLVLALVAAIGLAYLLIRPFMLRISRPQSQIAPFGFSSETRQLRASADDCVHLAPPRQAHEGNTARSTSKTGMPSQIGYVRAHPEQRTPSTVRDSFP